jgi:hypothetical protein
MSNLKASWALLFLVMINAKKYLVFMLLIGGCAKKDLPPSQQVSPVSSPPKIMENLIVELTLDKPSYTPKELVRMTLTVTNRSQESFHAGFRSAQSYDFIVKEGEREVWRWSSDRMFAQMLQDVQIEPGKTLSYKETWDQRDNVGSLVPRGRYEVVGILKTTPEVVSGSVPFELVD